MRISSSRLLGWLTLGLVVLCAGSMFLPRGGGNATLETGPKLADPPDATEERTLLAESEMIAPRQPAAEPAETTTPFGIGPAEVLAPPFPIVRGRVVDLDGWPVAGATISEEAGNEGATPVLATSDADGLFEFETMRPERILVANTPELRALRVMVWRWRRSEGDTIVVAPCVTVRGMVFDDVGAPLPGVEIAQDPASMHPPGEGRTERFHEPADPVVTHTDAGGAFALERAFAFRAATLHARLEGCKDAVVPIPRDPGKEIRIRLERAPEVEEVTIRGAVLRSDGTPASRATVWYGPHWTLVDATGAFELSFPRDRHLAGPLAATEKGSQPGEIAWIGDALTSGEEIAPIQIVLGPPPRTIRGRVLDDHGKPLPGAVIRPIDDLVLGPSSIRAESLALGTNEPCRTDARGDFELGGLSNRDYRLHVFDAGRCGSTDSDPIPAGASGVVIAYPSDAVVPEISGRVVGWDGTPVARVNVVLAAAAVSPYRGTTELDHRRPVVTSADGTFRLREVPRRGSHLQLGRQDILQGWVPLEGYDLARPLELRVERLLRVRFDNLAEGPEPRTITALDAQGEEVYLAPATGISIPDLTRTTAEPADIDYQVSERTAELVISRSRGDVLARRAVKLTASGVNVVRW